MATVERADDIGPGQGHETGLDYGEGWSKVVRRAGGRRAQRPPVSEQARRLHQVGVGVGIARAAPDQHHRVGYRVAGRFTHPVAHHLEHRRVQAQVATVGKGHVGMPPAGTSQGRRSVVLHVAGPEQHQGDRDDPGSPVAPADASMAADSSASASVGRMNSMKPGRTGTSGRASAIARPNACSSA